MVRNFLQKAYGKELANKEVAEYKNRLVRFFSLLVEIDQRNKKNKEVVKK